MITKEEAMAGLEAMDLQQRRRDSAGMSYMVLNAIPSMLAAGAFMGPGYKPNLGRHRGWYRKTKNTNNSPNRAKGMKPFDIDGMTVWAGTLKAARKKAKVLIHQQIERS